MTDTIPTTFDEALADLAASTDLVEVLQESLADAELALEDRGWARLGARGLTEFSEAGLRRAAEVCRVMAVGDPLIKRGINLRVAQVWSQGVTITARQDTAGGDGQDVNVVVQAFLEDPSNVAAFTGAQAREEQERSLATDGNLIWALPTNPLTGRVQVRTIPLAEISDIITNPDDATEPWYYLRTWTVDARIPQPDGTLTRRSETYRAYYPALGFDPSARALRISGVEVRWDTPVLHGTVNRLSGWRYGIGDVYAAIWWARGYREFLEAWLGLMKSLTKWAWRATAKGSSATVRSSLAAAPAGAGQVAVSDAGTSVEAIPKTGATIDADSARPLAVMVAAALDVPVTMLLGDPGVTGARATAETLDAPFHKTIQMRRDRWGAWIVAIIDHVIRASVIAPRGLLQGGLVRDTYTGRTVVRLAGGQDTPKVDVVWAPLDDETAKSQLDALTAAKDLGVIPLDLLARLALAALDVENPDDIIDEMRDADGVFVPPPDVQAAASALAAVGRGDMPNL